MIWTLIALAYLVIAMSVACFGAFGIAVTKWDRQGVAWQRMPGFYHPDEILKAANMRTDGQTHRELHSGARYQGYQYREERWPLIWLAAATAVFWPIGVPLYFSVRKGHMVADELARRDAA